MSRETEKHIVEILERGLESLGKDFKHLGEDMVRLHAVFDEFKHSVELKHLEQDYRINNNTNDVQDWKSAKKWLMGLIATILVGAIMATILK